jgi:uncharacterized membrane protein (UPF0127 family)
MRYKLYVIITVVALASLALLVFWPSKARTQVAVGGVKFDVLVVDTPQTREQGLSGRTGLEERQGMLFVFDKPDQYVFWMKDMLFPMDILYIRNGRIVDMALNMPPPKTGETPVSFQPSEAADRVLEVAAGTAQKLGWTKGTRVSYP